jgi:hypothetical protein
LRIFFAFGALATEKADRYEEVVSLRDDLVDLFERP